MGDVSYGAANRKQLLIHHSTVSPPTFPGLVIGPSACKQKNISPTEYKPPPHPSSDYTPSLIWIYYDILELNLRLVYAKRVLFSTGIACFKVLFSILIMCLPSDVNPSIFKSSYKLFRRFTV